MKFYRVMAVSRRVFRDVANDKRSLAMLFLAPIFAMCVFGIAFSGDVEDVNVIIVNQDQGYTPPMENTTYLSQTIISNLDTGVLNIQNMPNVDEAHQKIGNNPFIRTMVGDTGREGWFNFRKEIEKASPEFQRPHGEGTLNEDTVLIYFSSGTTGMPKMIMHDHTYSLGHIITARYWQNVMDDGLHYTVADTGWAKAMWGQIYGQWISGTAIFVYDYERFDAAKMLGKGIPSWSHHLLRTTYHIPFPYQGRPLPLRLFYPKIRSNCWRTIES